eukprot:m.27794 g.27794  ORF g.27794 m.27794 type:complete len:167 (+) comp11777_c0_seq23:265-765(+)
MPFESFISQLQQGSDRLYLTTQDVAVDDQGRPGLMAPPVTNLREDFPLRPDLLSTLQPFNYNLWIGQTQTGSSSGLHHDFHDNLYVLIHGCKRFRLISPKDAEAMATAGDIAQVHSNGRICYQVPGVGVESLGYKTVRCCAKTNKTNSESCKGRGYCSRWQQSSCK